MHRLRFLALIPLIFGLTSVVFGDFDGPAPLSWRWAQPTEYAPSGSPLVDGDTIYVSVGTRIFALDRQTGNQKWKFPTTESIQGHFKSNPVMCDGTLVSATDTTLYGVDPATGVQKWYYKLQDPQQEISSQPVAVNKYVVFPVSAEYLVAINGADGKETWPAQQHVFDLLKGNLGSSGDLLFYFTQHNALCALNVASPTKVKTYASFSTLSESATPVVVSDILYVNTSSYVTALNALNGSERWQTDTQEDLVYGPAITASNVAVVSRDGILTIMDLHGKIATMKDPNSKGVIPMKIDLQSGAATRPTAAGELFMVPTLNGALNLVDPKTGRIVWRYVVHPMSAEEVISTTKNNQNGGGGKFGAGGGIGGGGLGGGGLGGGGLGGGTTGGGNGAGTGGGQGNRGGANGQPGNLLIPDPADFDVPVAGPTVVAGNTLLVLVEDGSLLAFDRDSGVDVTGPEVKMLFPSEGSEVSGQDLSVVFRISDDNSGVNESTISVTCNGKPVDNAFTADGKDTVQFSLYGKNKPLPDGRTEFVVSVSDWMGNITTEKFSLSIDSSLPSIAAPAYPQNGGRGGPGRGGGLGGGGFGGGRGGGFGGQGGEGGR
ncbi:MAG TPA: PQQ-binding-like beta-propeller repeat protein [Fimbriimonadaceae bacterium]